MKRFIYLVQCKNDQLPECYNDLAGDDSDVLKLTWGAEIPGSIYFPKSSWTQGRNRLLAEATASDKPRYLYYIFLDDDLVLEQGTWRIFEATLLKYEPAIATPYYSVYWGAIRNDNLEATRCLAFDAMCNAFHREVVEDRLLLPYYSAMDAKSWWFSQWFVIELAHRFYSKQTLQINTVHVGNLAHGEYPKDADLESACSWFFGKVVRHPLYKWRSVLPKDRIIHFQRRVRMWYWRNWLRFRPPGRKPATYAIAPSRRKRSLIIDSGFWNDRPV